MSGEKRLVLEDRVVVPLVTPTLGSGFTDRDSAARICRLVNSAGIHAVLVVGRTGDMESMNTAGRVSMTEAVKESFEGNVLLCVGDRITTAYSGSGPYVGKSHVISHIRTARWLGADAVVVPTLFYCPETHEDVPEAHHMEPYFAEVIELAKEEGLPVLLYNNPGMTGRQMPLKLVEKLAKDEWVVGIKDSSGDMEYFGRLIDIKMKNEGFMVYQGDEYLVAESIGLGADGIVPSLGNLLPGLMASAVYNPHLQGIVKQIGAVVYGNRSSLARLMNGLRYALGVAGLCREADSRFNRLQDEEKEAISCLVEKHFSPKKIRSLARGI